MTEKYLTAGGSIDGGGRLACLKLEGSNDGEILLRLWGRCEEGLDVAGGVIWGTKIRIIKRREGAYTQGREDEEREKEI